MTATATFKQANLFAGALDANDFSTAQELLSKACTYERGHVVIKGAGAIIDSYRQSSERAQALFDTVFYESDVISSTKQLLNCCLSITSPAARSVMFIARVNFSSSIKMEQLFEYDMRKYPESKNDSIDLSRSVG